MPYKIVNVREYYRSKPRSRRVVQAQKSLRRMKRRRKKKPGIGVP